METRGERLKRLRKEKNLSQSELAQRIKSTRSSISMYECDERWPDFETLDNLAELFDVSFDYILCKSDVNNGYPVHVEIQNPHDEMVRAETYYKKLNENRQRFFNPHFKSQTPMPFKIMRAYEAASPEIQLAVRKLLDLEEDHNGDR